MEKTGGIPVEAAVIMVKFYAQPMRVWGTKEMINNEERSNK